MSPMRSLPLALAIMLASVSVSAAETFTFTAIPDQDATRLMARFERIASYLENKLGVEVKYIPVKSYAGAVTAFRNDQVQLAWFGGLSGVQARKLVPGSVALAQGYEDQFFVTYFIANTSTGLTYGQEGLSLCIRCRLRSEGFRFAADSNRARSGINYAVKRR